MSNTEPPKKYIDPLVDFGFKKIFGSEPNRDLLIAFLNEIFRGRKEIVELSYNKNEHPGDTEEIGGVIFDLTCTASNGEQFIIEVQRSTQVNLKRRMLYYGSKLISDQAPKGKRKEWNYGISEVYVIVLMDGFAMPGSEGNGQYLHDICLCNRDTGKVFYDDLGFIYLELINFAKEESELETDLDSWLFVLKNMASLDKIPLYLRKPVFEKLFNIAEYSKLTKEEKDMYDTSLKRKWDAKAVLDYAVNEADTKAREEERAKAEKLLAEERTKTERLLAEQRAIDEAKKLKSAKKMKESGFDISMIADILELSIEEIEKL